MRRTPGVSSDARVILADVNVLIYAFRKDCAQHAVCKPWLDKVISGDAQFGVSPLVLNAVARITTNSRVFKQPSSIGEVFGYCDNLLGQPHCEIVPPGERHWEIFRRLCIETGTRGSRITDAWFAALAIEHGCTWITYDRDYARFTDLDWREPGV
jgi:toxin-antitoxin system PIN domain toxin